MVSIGNNRMIASGHLFHGVIALLLPPHAGIGRKSPHECGTFYSVGTGNSISLMIRIA